MTAPSANFSTRTTDGPLQVYLDSSDYSMLSEAMHNDQHPTFETLKRLSEFVDLGLIEIRFSTIHLIEIAHLDAESKNWALRRAECIQHLSKD